MLCAACQCSVHCTGRKAAGGRRSEHRLTHLVDRFGDLAFALRPPRNLGPPAASITLHMPTLENSSRRTSPSRSPAPCCEARFTKRKRARRDGCRLSKRGKKHTGCTAQGKACSLHVAMAVEGFHAGNQLVVVAAVDKDLRLKSRMPTRWRRQRVVKHGAGAWRFAAYLSVLLNGIRENRERSPARESRRVRPKRFQREPKTAQRAQRAEGRSAQQGQRAYALISSSGLSAPASMVSVETKDCSRGRGGMFFFEQIDL